MPITGATPLGNYVETVEVVNELPVPILADFIDPDTGDIVSLDESRDPIDGAVIEGFRVERGTGAAVIDVGQTLRKVRHTDESSLAEIPTRARDGLQELELQGLVRLESGEITLSGDGSTVGYTATVRDLTVGASDPSALLVRRANRR